MCTSTVPYIKTSALPLFASIVFHASSSAFVAVIQNIRQYVFYVQSLQVRKLGKNATLAQISVSLVQKICRERGKQKWQEPRKSDRIVSLAAHEELSFLRREHVVRK